MHIINEDGMLQTPALYMNGRPVEVGKVKFLGLYLNRCLNWKGHIEKLKGNCQQAMNLIRSVIHQWTGMGIRRL